MLQFTLLGTTIANAPTTSGDPGTAGASEPSGQVLADFANALGAAEPAAAGSPLDAGFSPDPDLLPLPALPCSLILRFLDLPSLRRRRTSPRPYLTRSDRLRLAHCMRPWHTTDARKVSPKGLHLSSRMRPPGRCLGP
jgi:hypothetical protein